MCNNLAIVNLLLYWCSFFIPTDCRYFTYMVAALYLIWNPLQKLIKLLKYFMTWQLQLWSRYLNENSDKSFSSCLMNSLVWLWFFMWLKCRNVPLSNASYLRFFIICGIVKMKKILLELFSRYISSFFDDITTITKFKWHDVLRRSNLSRYWIFKLELHSDWYLF